MAANGKIQVEKGVPVPKYSTRSNRFPWSTMEVGDSFLLPADVKRGSISQCLTVQRMVHNRRFVTRTTLEGIRVWRTE